MIVTNKSIYTFRNYYDESGNKIKTEHSDGRIQRWFYDDENRIVKYVFDNRNNVFEHREEYYRYRSVKHAVVVTMERSNGYSKTTWYDTLNNLRPVYSVSKYGKKTYYNYDDAGNLVSRHTSNGYRERYIYDERGLLVETIHESGRSTKYNYDADNKLIETIYPDGRFETLMYDRGGQLISKSYNNSDVFYVRKDNELFVKDLSSGDIERYIFNENNQIIKRISRKFVVDCVYDSLNRLILYKREYL